MGAKLVSVIVPTLNSDKTVSRCLSSVRTQQFRPVELIVVDGGSQDRTIELSNGLADTVIVGRSKRSTARRLGADVAQGDYLLFLDSDQVVSSDLLAECVAIVSRRVCEAVRIPESDSGFGIWFRCRELDRRIGLVDQLGYPRFISREAYFRAGQHSTDVQDYLEDRDLYLRLLDAGVSMVWSRNRITNLMNHVNPLEIGRKGSRAANDADVFYRKWRTRGEGLRQVVFPRVRNVLNGGVINGTNIVTLGLFPIYVLAAYGPRLLTTSIKRLVSRPR